MVDVATWNRLDDAAREEFRGLLGPFQAALRKLGIHDGHDLEAGWSVRLVDGAWVIGDGTTILDGVTSARRDVIAALHADGVQNLNR